MGILLAAVRTPILLLTYMVFAVIGALVWPIRWVSPQCHLKLLTVVIRAWAGISCLILNIRVRVAGETPVPDGCLIVSNHVGTPDIFVLGSCFPAFYVAKSEIADWPLFKYIARLGCAIFAERNRKHQISELVEKMRARLAAGCSVILFPEGGATDGSTVRAFKTSPFEAAVRAGSAVVAVTVVYHDSNRPSVACWYGVSFLSHIFRLLKQPRLDVTCIVHAKIEGETDRRRLAETSRCLIVETHRAQIAAS